MQTLRKSMPHKDINKIYICRSVIWGLTSFASGIILLSSTLGAQERRGVGVAFENPVILNRFYKGNIHTHTRRSDGDGSPRRVASWYKSHGYHFLALTDHSRRTNLRDLAGLEKDKTFCLLPGEEATFNIHPRRHSSHQSMIPVHGNALCSQRRVQQATVDDRDPRAQVPDVLTQLIANIRASGGIPQINHPNYEIALTLEDILQGVPPQPSFLMEIANQHPGARNSGIYHGTQARLSTEQLWDNLLIRGRIVYGTATDDMHHLARTRAVVDHGAARARRQALGGQGWVQVAANALAPTEICAALESGQFYSSTGVDISTINIDNEQITLTLNTPPGTDAAQAHYTTRFVIGIRGIRRDIRGGRDPNEGGAPGSPETTIQSTNPIQGLNPSYRLTGDEIYVRAVVTSSTGAQAWTQPAFVRRLGIEQPGQQL